VSKESVAVNQYWEEKEDRGRREDNVKVGLNK
jgi:hypothetical protein